MTAVTNFWAYLWVMAKGLMPTIMEKGSCCDTS